MFFLGFPVSVPAFTVDSMIISAIETLQQWMSSPTITTRSISLAGNTDVLQFHSLLDAALKGLLVERRIESEPEGKVTFEEIENLQIYRSLFGGSDLTEEDIEDIKAGLEATLTIIQQATAGQKAGDVPTLTPKVEKLFNELKNRSLRKLTLECILC